MRVLMKTLSAGPAGVLKAGEVHDLDDAQAQQFIKGGFAVEHTEPEPEPAPAEQATALAGETAEDPANKQRRVGGKAQHKRK